MIVPRTEDEMVALDKFAGTTLNYLLHETDLGRFAAEESILAPDAMKRYAGIAYDMAEAMLAEREDRDAIYVEG